MDKDTFMTILKEESVEATSVHQSITGGDGEWWHVYAYGALRSGCDQCPITFVANLDDERWDPSEWEGAAKHLEMDPVLAKEIVLASDGRMFEDGFSQALRDELIDATNAEMLNVVPAAPAEEVAQ